MKKIKYILLALLLAFSGYSQNIYDTLKFIRQDKNIVHFSGDNQQIEKFKEKLQNINLQGSKKINILHIGDSHLQAAFLTEKIRQNLFQHYLPKDTIAEPGFIFPYTLANTNNPYYYKVDYTGNWEMNKNTNDTLSYKLGLSGITVATHDSTASFSVKMLNNTYDFPVKYYFNKVKILHSIKPGITLKINGFYTQMKDNYSTFHLAKATDSIHIEIFNPDTAHAFELYGLILEHDQNKIGYHTIGVNGATAQSYLKCELLPSQVEEINPDLTIISLGTNETFNENFSSLENKLILKDFINQIRVSAPNSSIILAVPGDHIKNDISNKNIMMYRETLFQIKDELHTGLWDFYSIMGGKNAVLKWHNYDFTANDKIHFKRAGYQLQGELFVNAFIKFFDHRN
ncbi:MAG: GDSL-type esterase/lipase family protein [Bacteroidota bacterium]|nr:GDSL-type esterase/lipase family protein [Bacteroidota bacterium]